MVATSKLWHCITGGDGGAPAPKSKIASSQDVATVNRKIKLSHDKCVSLDMTEESFLLVVLLLETWKKTVTQKLPNEIPQTFWDEPEQKIH